MYTKANWTEFKLFIKISISEILKKAESLTVEELWVQFKNTLEEGISKFIPTKRIIAKPSLPWITKSVKKLIHKRDKLYRNIKKPKTNKKSDHDQWVKFKKN